MNKRNILLLSSFWILITLLQIGIFSNLRIGGVAPHISLAVFSIFLIETGILFSGVVSAIVFGVSQDIVCYSKFGMSPLLFLLICFVIYLIKRSYINNFGSIILILTIGLVDIVYNVQNLLSLDIGVISRLDYIMLSALFSMIIALIYVLTFRTYGFWQKRELKINR